MMQSFRDLARITRAAGLTLAIAAAACARSEGDGGAGVRATTTTDSSIAPAPSPDSIVGASAPTAKAAPRRTVSSGEVAAPATAPAAPETPGPAAAALIASQRSARRVVVAGVDLTGVGYDRGSATAPVVVVNFSDFGCPFCGSFARETEPVLEREYVQTGKVFVKYVPFVMGMFPNGQQAALASECAADQGKFWAMHDRLYANQREWKTARTPMPVFQRYASAVGLDESRFTTCYAGEGQHPRTRQANAAADALGIRVTPSFVVNGRPVEGALPLPQFRQLLDAAVTQGR